MSKAELTFEIRPLVADDNSAWRGLWADYLEFYDTTVPEAVYASTFARLIGDDPQDFNCLLAISNDRPVGLAHYLSHRNNWKIENTCYLQDLYVDPTLRGSGIGRALIEAVYAQCDAAGVTTVHWMTHETNTTARQLYDRIGNKTPFIQYVRQT